MNDSINFDWYNHLHYILYTHLMYTKNYRPICNPNQFIILIQM